MSSKAANPSQIPFSLTPEYDRSGCRDCVCSSCYKQEFCNRCSSCKEHSAQKTHCYRYEGAYNY